MKVSQAAELLTLCAAFDNRNPDETASQVWAEALDGMRPEDAREAVIQHYRSTHRWIMPSDVRAGVARLVKERSDALALGLAELPPELAEMDDGPEHTAAYLAWVKSGGRDVPQAQLTA